MSRKESQGESVAIVGQVNNHLPYLYGDSELETDFYDFVLRRSKI